MMSLRGKMRHSPLSQLYDEARLPQLVRRSLSMMLLANVFGNLHAIICGGGTTAMIGLANQLQAGDLAFGILNGIPQAAALLQIPFSMLVNRTHKRKKYILTLGVFSRVLWLFFGMIPLVVPASPSWLPLWTLIFLLGLSSCCSAVINVSWFPWFSDLAPLRIRGRWFSLRDTLIAGCNFLFGLLVAYLLDALPAQSKYVIIFLIGGALGVMDMLCFAFCKESYSSPPKKLRLKAVLADVARNKPFLRLTVMWMAWCFTANLAGPYLGRYSMNEMGLNFMQLMVFGTMAASVGTILVMPRWGRALDRYGCRSVMLVAGIGASLCPAFYLLSTPGSVLPVFLHNFVGAIFWSGTNLAANSMQLSCSPDEMRPSYIAIFSCVTALAGTALGMVLGGALLEGMAGTGWFTGGFDRYKALFLLSVLLRFAITLLLVPRMENDRDGTPGELARGLIPAFHRKSRFRARHGRNDRDDGQL